MPSTAGPCSVLLLNIARLHAAWQHATALMLHIFRRACLKAYVCSLSPYGVQVGMNVVTTALIALDLSWIQDIIRQSESTGYSSLTRALVLASQAGRMTRLLRVMNLVGVFRVGIQPKMTWAVIICRTETLMDAFHATFRGKDAVSDPESGGHQGLVDLREE